MRKLNSREIAIKKSWELVLKGKIKCYALRYNGNWTLTKAPKKAYKVTFKTIDGLEYIGYPEYIEKTFMNIEK